MPMPRAATGRLCYGQGITPVPANAVAAVIRDATAAITMAVRARRHRSELIVFLARVSRRAIQTPPGYRRAMLGLSARDSQVELNVDR